VRFASVCEGLVEGESVAIEWRFTYGETDRVQGLASELVALGARVIVGAGAAYTDAARQATEQVPIVALAADPVARGWGRSPP
jgi:putative tryptophan/tyrosine transport system substrate-binding protein